MLADDLTSQDDGPNTRCLPRYGFTVVKSGTAAAGQRRRNVITNFGTVIAGNQCAEHLYRSTSRWGEKAFMEQKHFAQTMQQPAT